MSVVIKNNPVAPLEFSFLWSLGSVETMQNSIDDDSGDANDDASGGAAIDFGLILVVGSSPINRIVISRIGEKAGLRTVCATPDGARAALGDALPVLAILDGGADDRECDRLLDHLAGLRRFVAGGHAPMAIFLSNRAATAQPGRHAAIDKVMAKPVMPDRLQPVIQEMVDRLQRPL